MIQFLRPVLALIVCCLTACNNSGADTPEQQTTAETRTAQDSLRLMIAVVHQGPNIADSMAGRCDAALNLIAADLPRFQAITFNERNTAISTLTAQGVEPTASRIADQLDVDRLLFIRVMRLENILRVALTMTSAPDYLKSSEGVGYALIRYRNEQGERIYDTALLEALQRALADAMGDSLLFAQAQSLAPVRPAATLVVTGFQFIDNNIKPKWNIFEEKIPTSYEMVLRSIDALREVPGYVAYDLDSRDTMYAIRNLYMAENYHAPTPQEMSILESFDVRYMISGVLERRTQATADLTVRLGRLEKGLYREVASKTTTITADDRAQLLSAVQSLSAEVVRQ